MNTEKFVVEGEDVGQTLPAVARKHGFATTWSEARRLVSGGKVFLDGRAVIDETRRVRAGQSIELKRTAPRPRPFVEGRLVHDDAQVVVLDKPSGISSVPFEKRELGTAMDLIRAHWRADGKKATDMPLHIVHRIDKDTSGLIVFAKTKLAERFLAAQFRTHVVGRRYRCVVHGTLLTPPTGKRIETRFVDDRGDGIRGSTRAPGKGVSALTWVTAVEQIGEAATLCDVRLETGKTHQIRIHLAEMGHPLVGETVYVRDYTGELLPSQRLLLHAATLAFELPSGEKLTFESLLPSDFNAELAALRKKYKRTK